MLRIAIGIALLVGMAPIAGATSWKLINPEEYAKECPVIIRGTITSSEKAKPGQDHVDVVIRIEEIIKNVLSDVPLKVGDDFTTRRNVGTRESGSEDLDYPVKTRALWLVTLDDTGAFRVDGHPVHRQNAKLVLNLGTVAVLGRCSFEDFHKPQVTRNEWIAAQKLKNAWQSRKPEQEKARKLKLFTLSKELADVPEINAESMRPCMALAKDRRRDFLQYSDYVQPLKDEKLGEVIAFILEHDKDEEIRAYAATCLSGRELSRDGFVKRALLKALTDPTPRVRFAACIGLFQRKEPGCSAAIAALLQDKDKDVRFIAVRVLGNLREYRALPTILALYEREKADEIREFSFAESLAHLSEKKTSLVAAGRAVQSDNSYLRHLVVDSLRLIDTRAVVPVAMEWLASEMRRAIDKQPGSDFDTGRYASLCFILTRGGEKYQTDPVVWFEWWDKARAEYDAPPLKIDLAEVRKVYAAYQKVLEERRKPSR